VKLAVNHESLEAVAVKIVDLSKSPSVEKNIRKEVVHEHGYKSNYNLCLFDIRKELMSKHN